MSAIDIQMKRPLPTFLEWLEAHSPDTKADDFEAFADLAQRTQDTPLDNLTPDQRIFLRMWQGACVAAVELCNMEVLGHDTDSGTVVSMLPRVFACAAMYAFASVAKDDAPLRKIAALMTEDFSFAAKQVADDLMATTP